MGRSNDDRVVITSDCGLFREVDLAARDGDGADTTELTDFRGSTCSFEEAAVEGSAEALNGAAGVAVLLPKSDSIPPGFLGSSAGGSTFSSFFDSPLIASPRIPQASDVEEGATYFFTDSSQVVEPREACKMARGLDCATAVCRVSFIAVIEDLWIEDLNTSGGGPRSRGGMRVSASIILEFNGVKLGQNDSMRCRRSGLTRRPTLKHHFSTSYQHHWSRSASIARLESIQIHEAKQQQA